MKKAVAWILLLILLFGCGSVAVSAADANSKMDSFLIEELGKPGNDPIGVVIFLKPCYQPEDIDRIVYEKYTWTTSQEYLKYYRYEFRQKTELYIQQFIDDNSDYLNEIITWSSSEFIIAKVLKENVLNLAELDTVSSMNLYIDVPIENGDEPENYSIEEMIVGAANELYQSSAPFPPNDINMEFSHQFKNSNIYAVRFTVQNYCYIEIELEERIGGWLLWSGHYPEPYIFVDGHLFTLRESYEGGILTESMMAELAEASKADDGFLTKFVKGDADGDGEVSVIDATVIQRYDVEMIGSADLYKPLADTDGDGFVTVVDATVIQRLEAGMIDSI